MDKPVQVSVRIRPRLDGGGGGGSERYARTACLPTSDATLRLWNGKEASHSAFHSFCFDSVLSADDSQEEVYEVAAVGPVEAALGGANATVLAYGQTGSGKTHTILGSLRAGPAAAAASHHHHFRDPGAAGEGAEEEELPAEAGLLLRAVAELLQRRRATAAATTLVLGVSAVEVYMDSVRDLLSGGAEPAVIQPVLLRDAVRLPRLTYMRVDTLADMGAVYARAAARRAQRATAANDASSRSHAIFAIDLFQQPAIAAGEPFATPPLTLQECLRLRKEAMAAAASAAAASVPASRQSSPPRPHAAFPGAANPLLGPAERPVMHSRLTFVDLAGSEKAKKSGVSGDGMSELRSINASLAALCNVVRCMHAQSLHIPYRDSKLTTVLRDCFACPGARLSLVATVDPTADALEETLSTLHFANTVKETRLEAARGGAGGGAAALSAMAAEERFLTSLRAFDALKADLRICALENECPVNFLERAEGLFRRRNPLFDLTTLTPPRASEERAVALKALCYTLKAEWHRRSHPRAAEVEVTDAEFDDMVAAAVREAAERRGALAAALRAQEAAATEFSREHEAQLQVLTQEHAQYAQQRAARKALTAQRAQLTTQATEAARREAELTASLRALAENGDGDDDPAVSTDGKDLEAQQDETWEYCSSAYRRCVELCEARLRLWELLLANRALAAERRRHRRAASEPSVSSASRERSGSGRGSLDRPPAALTGILALGALQVNTEQRGGAAAADARKPRSPYDAPQYLEDVQSRLRLGVAARRVTSSGEAVRRVFYVTRSAGGGARLRWDDADHATRVSGTHHVDLSAVSAILLGQSTPGFERLRRRGSDGGDDAALSFSLVQRGAGGRVLDVICESPSDWEIFVVGLSRLTGVSPRFGAPAAETAESAESDATPPAVTPREALYCRRWHIPSGTYAECRRQVERQCAKRQRARLALTPGELCVLSGLDVVRASAMWLLLRDLGRVSNPGAVLNCFVEAETGEGEGAVTSAAE